MINFGGMLKTFIYLISSSLLYPVLLLLVILTLVVIIAAGGFFAEWLERLRLKKYGPQNLPDMLKKDQADPSLSYRVRKYKEELCSLSVEDDNYEPAVENLLHESSWQLWKSMDRFRLLVRAAPSLGLIGTLIPMGTGLAALGQGDMTKLTTDLVIAFTTTVVGLAIGTLAFFFYTVRRRWIEEDVKNMELITDLFGPNSIEETKEDEREIFPATAN